MEASLRRRILWGIGFIPLAVLLTMGILFLAAWTRAGRVLDGQRRSVADRMAALRSVKIVRPVLFEPAEEGNSWDLLAPALKTFSEIPDQELWCLPSYEMCRPEDAPEPGPGDTEKFLEKLGPLLDTLKRALRRPAVDPPFDFEDPVNHDTSIGNGALKASEILTDLAAHALERGDSAQAVDLIILTLGIADRLAVKSFMIRDQMAMVATTRGIDAVKEGVEKSRWSASDLSRIASVLEAVDRGRDVDWVEKEDLFNRSLVFRTFDKDLAELGPPGSVVASTRHYFSVRIMIADWFDSQNRYLQGMKEIAHLPPGERSRAASAVVRTYAQHPTIINQLLTPLAGKVTLTYSGVVMQLRLARVAVAVARFHGEQEEFPASLEQLVPKYLAEVPFDAFEGGALAYDVSGEAARIGSRSRDPKQDGKPLGSAPAPVDWGFPSWSVRRP